MIPFVNDGQINLEVKSGLFNLFQSSIEKRRRGKVRLKTHLRKKV